MSKGAPIIFTITIPNTVQHQVAAEAFAKFLLASNKLLEDFGLGSVEHRVGGEITQVPTELRSYSSGAYEP